MRKPYLKNLIIFFSCFILFLIFQLAVGFRFGDPDGFYHLKMARLLASGQITNQFPWLQYTTWNTGYADQHYLFHLLLIPFAQLRVEWLVIPMFSSVMVAAFWWLLQKLDIKWKAWWVLILLVGSTDFLFRLNVIKANTLSLVLLFGAIAFMHKKKYAWLVPLSFVFVWSYGGFVFLPIAVALWSITELVFEQTLNWKPLAYCLIGISAGIALHPQASHLLPYLHDQIFQAGLGANKTIPVGVEWNSYDAWYFLKSNFLIVALWLLSAALYIVQFKKSPATRRYGSFFFLLSAGFWLLALQHRRFIEYAAPFAVLFGAYITSVYLEKIKWPHIKDLLIKSWELWAAGGVLIVIVGCAGYININQDIHYFDNATTKDAYRGAAEWLIKNSYEGDIVFNTQWDQFPQLFYWDDKNYYIVGMDPTFMYLYDKNLYADWRKVTNDDPQQWGSAQNLHDLLQNNFKAKYIFIQPSRNLRLKEFLDDNLSSGLFSKVFEGNQTLVYRAN